MGGPESRSLRRGAVLAAVIALHSLLALILIVELRTSKPRSAAADFVSTLIILRAPEAPAPSSGPHRPPVSPKSAPVMPVEPLTVPPTGIAPPNAPDTSIDWSGEAQRAAVAVAEPRTYRSFSPTARIGGATGQRPAHAAGEQYRLDSGQWVVWVSERCYIVSGAPPIGLPEVLARSIPTSTVCQDNSPPAGELFKDLPAYQKYHAVPGVK